MTAQAKALLACTLCCALLAAHPAGAQPDTTRPSDINPQPPTTPASPANPTPAVPFTGDLFSLESLGAPLGQQLASHGVYLSGGYVGNLVSGLSGGYQRGAAYGNDVAYGIDLDLQQILGIPDARIHYLMDSRFGGLASGLNPFNGSAVGFLNGAGPSNETRLAEFTYEQGFLNDRVEIRAGRLSSTFYYTNLATDCQFESFVCGNPGGWSFNADQAFWPFATWGGQVTLRPTKAIYFRTGLYDDDNYEETHSGFPFNGGWSLTHADGLFLPAELGYTTTYMSDPYPRHYALGFYYDSHNFTDYRYNTHGQPLATAGGTPASDGSHTEVYAEFNQTVWKPNASSQEGLSVFGGVYANTSGHALINTYFTYGLLKQAPFASRPHDEAGLLGIVSLFDQRATDALDDNLRASGQQGNFSRSEEGFELQYTVELAPGIALKPFADIIIDPDQEFLAKPDPSDHVSFGLGLQISVQFNKALGLPFAPPLSQ